MKRRSIFPAGRACRAAACVALAAALCCGCAVLPAASSRKARSAASANQSLYDTSRLEDGELRLLSGTGGGGGVILSGGKVVYTASADELLSLVPDFGTQEIHYFFHSWSDASGIGGRRSALCDSTGRQLMEFDGEYSATLQDGILVLRQPLLLDGEYRTDDGYGTCRVIELATGKELAVPDGAYHCIVSGSTLFFNCYALPAGLAADDYDTESYLHSWMVVEDLDGNVLRTVQRCTASTSSYYLDDLPGWVQLDVYDAAGNFSSALYNPLSGEELSGFVQTCGNGTACFYVQEGQYQLVAFSGAEHTVLGEYDNTVSYYMPGAVITNNYAPGSQFYYALHDLTTGEDSPVYSIDYDGEQFALCTADNRLLVYDYATGERITDVTVEPVANLQDISLSCEGSGFVFLVQRDNDDYIDTAQQVYGPDGLVLDMTGLSSRYNNVSYLLTTAGGKALYFGSYAGVNNSYLTDVFDQDGNVIVQGLASCYSYYYASAYHLPQGVFEARRGFYYGWMDEDGKWVFCQSVFSDTDDDSGMYYYE